MQAHFRTCPEIWINCALRGFVGDVITPDDVFDAMEADLKLADLVIWVGISFEQSASTSYFRKVRRRGLGF